MLGWKRAHPGHSLFFVFLFVFAFLLGQGVSANQGFTAGLTIIDSPSPGSTQHAGSNLGIAVDVSGNGQLSADSASPTSLLPTHFDSLEIYLVSSQTNTNLTVSVGSSFLVNETGTVRHLNWPIPKCIPAGQYNLTFYELSHISGQPHFIITSVPIPVENNNPTSPCTVGTNQLLPQPQPSSPPSVPPFSAPGSQPSTDSSLITISLSSGMFKFPTMTSTIVSVSMETITSTVSAQQSVETIVLTQMFTSTIVQKSDNSGFVPVNGGMRNAIPLTILIPVPIYIFLGYIV